MVYFSPGSGAASVDMTRPDLPRLGSWTRIPRLFPGVEPLGEYEGSGLTDATFLVRKSSGQVVQVSRLLHLVLSWVDGRRTVGEIAGRVSAVFGRTVSAGNVEYLLDNKLAPLGLLDRGDDPEGAVPPRQDRPVLGLTVRCTLVPAAAVQHLARMFAPLFHPLVVGTVLGGLTTLDLTLLRRGQALPAFRFVLLHPLLLLLVLGLSMVSLLFHECGHAAACRYGGARPGAIGMGIYVVWPAFFTNVTDAYRLGRVGRIRTDLGGVYFNAIVALALAGAYLATGYAPLLAAAVLVHVEIVQQLLPSLRFDGYFILADLIGVPDLFRRIGPTLRSLIPGRPADPRVLELKRAARVTLTAWVLVIFPMILVEFTLVILNAPALARTFARSLVSQVTSLVTQFGQDDIPGGLLSIISLVLLVVPMIGLLYVFAMIGRQSLRSVIALNRRRPALRLPSVAVALLAGGLLTAHWGVLSWGHAHTSPRPPAVASATVGLTPPVLPAPPVVRAHDGPHQRAIVLQPVSAHGFDPLATPGEDPSDENDDLAGYAIDGSSVTGWPTQYYLGSAAFGGLKQGSGLILDMGRRFRLSSVTVTFGSSPGADVTIEVGDDNVLAASTLQTFTPVAAADGLGGRHTFRADRPAAGRYLLIWFTKLPQVSPGKFQAQVFNVVVRGTHHRPSLQIRGSHG